MLQGNKITFIREVEEEFPDIYGVNMFPEKKKVTDRKFPCEFLEIQHNGVSLITLEGFASGSTVEFC
ncbi:hypothetical protein D9M69_644410 [compost metagenome]